MINTKKIFSIIIGVLTIFVFTGTASASSEVIYDALPSTTPLTSYPSQPFQAQQTLEFGDEINLGGTGRTLDKVTVTMVTWARHSEYLTDERYPIDSTSWTHPITLNVYGTSVDINGEPTPKLATVTQGISIPWRPENNPTDCSDGFKWKDGNGNCVNGLAFNAVFDLSSLNVTLPNSVIVSVVYNTQSYGQVPMVVNGPYNSLNVAVPANQLVYVGTDVSNSEVFWNTLTASYYTLGGPAGYFRKDTNWSPYGTVAFKVEAKEILLSPSDKNQCKNEGWKLFNNPVFKNQGDCVSFVQSNPKALGNKNK